MLILSAYRYDFKPIYLHLFICSRILFPFSTSRSHYESRGIITRGQLAAIFHLLRTKHTNQWIAFKRYLSDEETNDLSIETIFSLFSFTFLRESVRKHRIRGSRRSFRAVSIESAGCRGRTDLFRSFAFTKGEGVASFAIAVSRG